MNFKNITNFNELKAANLKYGAVVHLVVRDCEKSFSTEGAEFICDAGREGVIFNLGGIPLSHTWNEIEELWPVLTHHN